MLAFFDHTLKPWLTGVLLFTLLPACTQVSTLRLSVPVNEAATVGKLTQPGLQTAPRRRLIAAGARKGHLPVGPILQVRVIRVNQKPVKLSLPFWAEEQTTHLVVEGPAGGLQAFPLADIDHLEVKTTVRRTYWSPLDVVLFGTVTLFTVLATVSWIGFLTDDP